MSMGDMTMDDPFTAMTTSIAGTPTSAHLSYIAGATLSMAMATATASVDSMSSMSMSNTVGSAGKVCQIQVCMR